MIWLITPAHGRHAISRVCFEQRRRMMDELAADGLEVRCVVIADDENLDLAAERGFDTIEAPNQLGRRYNDGISHAYERDATHIVPLGSDDWLHPDFLVGLPVFGDPIRTISQTVIVREDGRILAHLHVTYPGGCGFRCYPREIFDLVGRRPAEEGKHRSIDTSILRTVESRLGQLRWAPYDDPLGRVGFKTAEQLNTYRNIVASFGLREDPDPWTALAEAYPEDLIAQAQDAYGLVRVAA